MNFNTATDTILVYIPVYLYYKKSNQFESIFFNFQFSNTNIIIIYKTNTKTDFTSLYINLYIYILTYTFNSIHIDT